MNLNNKGTYVAVKFSDQTLDQIQKLQEDLKLLNKVSRDDLHSTVVYSRVNIPYKVDYDSISNQLVSRKQHLEIWDTSDGRALILVMDDAKTLMFRHEYAMVIGGTHDFPDYTPHITLSYNISVQKVPLIETEMDIIVSHEYVEDLKLDWADDKK